MLNSHIYGQSENSFPPSLLNVNFRIGVADISDSVELSEYPDLCPVAALIT